MTRSLLLVLLAGAGNAAMAQTPLYERDILPIFTANCFSCHGGTAMVGLDLRTRASALRGSHQGKVVKPGSVAESPLYEKVKSKAMPPPAFNFKLTDAQIELIRKWIESGAPGEEKRVEVAKEHVERFLKKPSRSSPRDACNVMERRVHRQRGSISVRWLVCSRAAPAGRYWPKALLIRASSSARS